MKYEYCELQWFGSKCHEMPYTLEMAFNADPLKFETDDECLQAAVARLGYEGWKLVAIDQGSWIFRRECV